MAKAFSGSPGGVHRSLIEDLALQWHKQQDGEYGCPGKSCPGVQRLTTFGMSCVEAALTEAAPPEKEPK